jgi:glutamyl/glutaminyl-tRNA synthetase
MKIETIEDAMNSLNLALKILDTADYSSLDALKAAFIPAIAESGKKNGQVLWPLRVALSGEEFSPGAFELAFILGRDESIRRIQKNIL